MSIDWTDVLGSDSSDDEIIESKARAFLGSPRQISVVPTGYLGFTLNYPRTTKFINANSVQQKTLYNNWIMSFKNTLGMQNDTDCVFRFEYCKSGQVHAHGYITLYAKDYFINGAVSDFSKAVLSHLPCKHNKFKEGCMYPDMFRYKCPSVCIQHYDADKKDETDKSSIEYWKQYIKKDDYNSFNHLLSLSYHLHNVGVLRYSNF